MSLTISESVLGFFSLSCSTVSPNSFTTAKLSSEDNCFSAVEEYRYEQSVLFYKDCASDCATIIVIVSDMSKSELGVFNVCRYLMNEAVDLSY